VSKLFVYRYDDEHYEENAVICSRGDSIDILTDAQKHVELAIRATFPDASNIRGTSLYTWADEATARRLWKFSNKKYLYELEIDESDVRHTGELNCYSAAGDEVAKGSSPDCPIRKYWSGEHAEPPYVSPRVEVLVSQATVRKRHSREGTI
jgi:hypothetical protein